MNTEGLFSKIDALPGTGGGRNIIIAVDGRCASGKTTFSGSLHEKYDCNVFHMDDFFLRPGQRTAERLSKPGGNVDYERFLSEILLPLYEDREVVYQRYDCFSKCLLPPLHVEKKRLNIVEGVYSLHPELFDYYDMTVFLDISEEEQRKRILKRNSPLMAEKFFTEWIPLEERYFKDLQIREKAGFII